MGKTKNVSLISMICWSSAILFYLWGILMLSSQSSSSPGHSYLLTVGAVMMFGWAFLLVWADRDHYYRKGVFFITALVAVGLLFAQMYGYFIGALSAKVAVSAGTLLCAVIILFTLSYFAAKRTGCSKRYKQHLILKHLLTRIF